MWSVVFVPKKKTTTDRKFVYVKDSDILRQTVDSKTVYEMTKEETKNAMKNAQIAIRNIKFQMAQEKKEISEYRSMIKEYKKILPRFKEGKNAK